MQTVSNFYIYKMGETNYYQKNRDEILNRAKEYYKNNRELIREGEKNKCKSLSEDEKK